MGLDETLTEQIDYYRQRAAEYDETAVGDVEAASRDFGRWIDRLDPGGDVLEIACGTGLWTQHLVGLARRLTAIDSSPEMIHLARSRVADTGAEFIVADVFTWQPTRRYDSVFFGNWLSHVPPQRFGAFWELLERCLAPGGRVLFVDEGAPRASMEYPDRSAVPGTRPPLLGAGSARASGESSAEPASAPIVVRRLRDGTVHRIVKIFYEPTELSRSLAELGWSANVELVERGFIVGVARRG